MIGGWTKITKVLGGLTMIRFAILCDAFYDYEYLSCMNIYLQSSEKKTFIAGPLSKVDDDDIKKRS